MTSRKRDARVTPETQAKAKHNEKLGHAVGSAKKSRETIRSDFKDFGQRLITPGEYDDVLWWEGKP